MLTTTISPTKRRFKAIPAKRRAGGGCREETEIRTRTLFLETRLPHSRNNLTNRVVVVTLTPMRTNFAREDAGASSGSYIRSATCLLAQLAIGDINQSTKRVTIKTCPGLRPAFGRR